MPKTDRKPVVRRMKKKPKARSPSAPRKSSPQIEASLSVMEILTLLPESENLLREYGLHCFQCSGAEHETLAEGCRSHGWDGEAIDNLVSDLNTLLAERKSRHSEHINLTLSAARALKELAKGESRPGAVLIVTTDSAGGFCMEFGDDAPEDHRTFFHPEEPSVRIAASLLTLARIGGATIDMRDGRFKLDLPEDGAKPCACSDSCRCEKKES